MKTKLLSCFACYRSPGHRRQWGAGNNGRRLGLLSVPRRWGALFDGTNFIDTLGANYTDLTAPGGNVPGPAAAVFGTMYLDGQFGSINTPLDGTDLFVPSAAAPNSLSSNLGAPAGPDFNSFAILTTNGQTAATSDFTMTALSTVTVVFGADLGTSQGNTWSISFGGKTNTGTSSVADLVLDRRQHLHARNLGQPHFGRHPFRRGPQRSPSEQHRLRAAQLRHPGNWPAVVHRQLRSTPPKSPSPSPPRQSCCSRASRGWPGQAAAAPDLRSFRRTLRNRHSDLGVAVPASRSPRCDFA